MRVAHPLITIKDQEINTVYACDYDYIYLAKKNTRQSEHHLSDVCDLLLTEPRSGSMIDVAVEKAFWLLPTALRTALCEVCE